MIRDQRNESRERAGSPIISRSAARRPAMRKTLAAVLAITVGTASLASPAHADALFAVTPSGAAEEVFAFDAKQTVAKLSSHCIDVRWTVISSSDGELVCEAPLNIGQSIMGQLLMGNSYSTPPRRFVRFNAAHVGNLTRVQASGWVELQMAFGQTRRTELDGADFKNNILGFMTAAGGQLPVGTRFPNHALLGVRGASATSGRNTVYRLTEVSPGSSAEEAGLVVGDMVTKIAGRRVKDDASVFDALNAATKTPTYFVEVVRDAKPVKLAVARAYRDPVSQVTSIAERALAPPPVVAAPPASVADELAKFAKLRADGVISEIEFQTQKRKLLTPLGYDFYLAYKGYKL